MSLAASPSQLAELCRRRGIQRLRVFGSALREDFRPESDVDLLVEFCPGRTPGLDFVRLADELTQLFRHPVDLHTPASLSRYFREQVLAEAQPLYVEA